MFALPGSEEKEGLPSPSFFLLHSRQFGPKREELALVFFSCFFEDVDLPGFCISFC